MFYYQGKRYPGNVLTRCAGDYYVTPQMFGAKGDNVDDTEAFQAALDAAAEKKATVLLPEGIYRLHRAVDVPIGVSICGVNKAKSIVCSSGINLSQFNTISNFTIKTIEPPDGSETIDLINIHSDRMKYPYQEYLANITICDIYFLGSHPSGAVKTPANMIVLECRRRKETRSDGSLCDFKGFYNVTIKNVFADRFFKYGIYFKQHIEENIAAPWMTKINLNNVFLGYPRWGIKGEVFVKDKDGNPFEHTAKRYKIEVSGTGVSGQWSENYSIGFIDIEYGNITTDGCLIDTPEGEYHIVVRDETCTVNLQQNAFLKEKYPPVRIAQRKADRSVADRVTAVDPNTGETVRVKPVLIKDKNGNDYSPWWHMYRTLSDYSASAQNVSTFHPGYFINYDHSEADDPAEALKKQLDSERQRLNNAQWWPMYRCIEYDKYPDRADVGFLGMEFFDADKRSGHRNGIKPGILGFDKQRNPVYSSRTKNDDEYILHRFLTDEYMPHGTTEKRMENANEGVMYFDTDLGRPVWSDGHGGWVDPINDVGETLEYVASSFGAATVRVESRVVGLETKTGDIEAALDAILAIQNNLIGGDSE